MDLVNTMVELSDQNTQVKIQHNNAPTIIVHQFLISIIKKVSLEFSGTTNKKCVTHSPQQCCGSGSGSKKSWEIHIKMDLNYKNIVYF